jgi:hypothetical protein
MIQHCTIVLDHVFSTDAPLSAFLKCVMWNRIITKTAISDSLPEVSPGTREERAVISRSNQAQRNTLPSAMVCEANSIRDIVLSLLISNTPSLLQTWISCACALPVQEKLLLQDLEFPSFTEALLGAAEDILSRPGTFPSAPEGEQSFRLLRAFAVAAGSVELVEPAKVRKCLALLFHNLCTGAGGDEELRSVGQKQSQPLSIKPHPALPATASKANAATSKTRDDLCIASDNSPMPGTATVLRGRTLLDVVSWCVMCTEE